MMPSRREIFFLLIICLVILADQAAKAVIQLTVEPRTVIPIIPNLFSLTQVHNTGAAFGILQGTYGYIIWLSLIVLGIILFCYDSLCSSRLGLIGAGLISGGIIGNLIDRVFLGYVIDFLEFPFWPAFNIADSSLCIGSVMLAYALFTQKEVGTQGVAKQRKNRKNTL